MSAEGDGTRLTAPSIRNRFPRRGRLKRRHYLRALFDRSRGDVYTVGEGTIRVLARVVDRDPAEQGMSVQVGFSPGRRRTAVERNRIRRILRETYRTHQHALLALFTASARVLTMMVLYRGRTDESAERIPRDLPRALDRAIHHFRERILQPGDPAPRLST